MSERFLGWHCIEDHDGSPYMLRAWIGRLRLHVFYRGDHDPDPHDHPWGFWTFPLTSYIEEVTLVDHPTDLYPTELVTVAAWRLHYRPATYTHRVICRVPRTVYGPGPFSTGVDRRKIVTLVWREKTSRKWGFLKHRDGSWCWVYWKDYVFGTGKTAPCAPTQEVITDETHDPVKAAVTILNTLGHYQRRKVVQHFNAQFDAFVVRPRLGYDDSSGLEGETEWTV